MTPENEKCVAEIKAMAGTKSGPDIAESLGITPGHLYALCRRNGISLPRPKEYARRPKKIDLGEAADALRAAGYKVIPPDPLRGMTTSKNDRERALEPGRSSQGRQPWGESRKAPDSTL